MLFHGMEDKKKRNERTKKIEPKNICIKKERKHPLKRYSFSQFFSISWIKETYLGKVSLYTSVKRASIAVETAFVLPVFFLGVVAMIAFMDIYKIQTEHLMKLCEKAKEAGMYAYVLEGKGPEHIVLPDFFTYSPVSGILPLPEVRMFQTVKVHAWTGKEYGNGDKGSEQQEEEQMVYITESGSVYHKDIGCSYINLSVNHVLGKSVSNLRNQYGEKYSACEICAKNQNIAGMVYITDTGNRYHNLESCSGLKRTVKMVKYSQVEGTMHACSRCG